MRIETHKLGAVTIIEPYGPVVQDDADAFGSRLRSSLHESLGRVVVDVTQVPYLDSRGLEALADVAGELQETGQTLHVSGANETLRTVFELTELSALFDHYQDVNTAVRSFL